MALCALGLLGSSVACSAGGDDDTSARPVTNEERSNGTGAGNTASPGTGASTDTAASSGASTSNGTSNTVPATGTPVGAAADGVSLGASGPASGATSVSGSGSSASPDGPASGIADAGADAADAGESIVDEVDEADAGAPEADAGRADAGAAIAEALGDGQIVTVVDVLNASEVEQAQAVLPRLQNDAVRAFAQIMIEEHETARVDLGALATQQQIAPANSDVADQLRAQSQQVQSELAATDATQIDSAYLAAQVTAHGDAEALLADLSAAADSQPLAAQLNQLRLNVQGHSQSASALQASLESDTAL